MVIGAGRRDKEKGRGSSQEEIKVEASRRNEPGLLLTSELAASVIFCLLPSHSVSSLTH